MSSTSIESTQPSTVQLPSPAPSLELNAIALNNQGVAKIEVQDFRGAVSDFTAAIAQQPKLAEAYLGRGDASFSLEKYPTALQDLIKALQLKPDLPRLTSIQGMCRPGCSGLAKH
ncbi:MAG TPA: tetratricopeptide repeat protein [Leptolyngbyaceae cyanobacterium M33_DOE_097]|uniref:Tetratricopeptide repeat protein n=1 Tax=Oscillatoriales cyanobacterium SpSt-418 TaxID=2282169 RepID=A0A7C3KGZ1_9CYAN|nr:tetratricopeptide repeat protein [Leptolyngbyaceae cyanobacterium M33_DOE_097]